jgi:hypothetical protein
MHSLPIRTNSANPSLIHKSESSEKSIFPVVAFKVSRNLLKESVSYCQPQCMGSTVDLLSQSDLVLSVYDRIEGMSSSNIEDKLTQKIQKRDVSKILESSYTRDGILMQSVTVLVPLMTYALNEIKRRTLNLSITKSEVSDGILILSFYFVFLFLC